MTFQNIKHIVTITGLRHHQSKLGLQLGSEYLFNHTLIIALSDGRENLVVFVRGLVVFIKIST